MISASVPLSPINHFKNLIMKQLLIKVFDEKHTCIETIICKHMDACNSNTVLFESRSTNEVLNKKAVDLHIPYNIHHWNLLDGLITIYYKNGFEMEISRINNA